MTRNLDPNAIAESTIMPSELAGEICPVLGGVPEGKTRHEGGRKSR